MTRGKFALLAWSILVAGVQATNAAQCEPEKASQKYPGAAAKVVRVGVNPVYPPFSFNDPKDLSRLTGLEVDVIESVMRCAGFRFEFVKGPQAGLYPALFGGSLDLIVGNVFIRPDRAEKAGFVLFMQNGQSLVVRKGNPKGVRTTTDMCGLSATGAFDGSSALMVQTISKACVDNGKAAITWVPAADQEPAYRSLGNDRVDMVMDGAASAALRINSAEGKVFEVPFTIQSGVKSGVMTAKGNTELLGAVGDGLRVLQDDGHLKALMVQYGLKEEWLVPVEVRP